MSRKSEWNFWDDWRADTGKTTHYHRRCLSDLWRSGILYGGWPWPGCSEQGSSLLDGAVSKRMDKSWYGSVARMYYEALGKKYGFNYQLNPRYSNWGYLQLFTVRKRKTCYASKQQVCRGTYTNVFEGVVRNIERRYRETTRMVSLGTWTGYDHLPLPDCKETRFNKTILAVTIDGNIHDVTSISIKDCIKYFENLK